MASAKPKRRTAFVALIDSSSKDTEHPRILVVRNRNNKWMLPGGNIDPIETVVEGVVRELREESGYITGCKALTLMTESTSTNFFVSEFDFGKLGHKKRNSIFKSRKKGETFDYGFVNFDSSSGKYYVTNYRGDIKSINPESFRKGTPSLIKLLHT